MRPPLHPARADEGFTLVEMLVSLVVLALIGALASTFLFQLNRVNTVRADLEVREELSLALRHVRTVVEGARLIAIDQDESGQAIYLRGGADTLKLATVARTGADRNGLRAVTIEVDQLDGRTRLIERHAFIRQAARPSPEEAFPISERIKIIQLEYFDGEHWMPEWQKPGRLPLSVRISVFGEPSRNIALSSIARLEAAYQD